MSALVHESGKDAEVVSVLANPVSTTLHPSIHTLFFNFYLVLSRQFIFQVVVVILPSAGRFLAGQY